MQKLTDVLWILHGHHSVLAGQSCQIPDTFSGFQGYNTPETGPAEAKFHWSGLLALVRECVR